MSGRGNSSRGERIFGRVTVILTFCFILFQFVVFVFRAVSYEPHPVPVPSVIHDTVYISVTPHHGEPADGYGSVPRRKRTVPSSDGASDITSDAGDSESPEPESSPIAAGMKEKKRRKPSGDSRWKWDVVELNSADSAALDGLPGIGGYYAKRILRYRERLGAFTEPEQLLEIRGIDSAAFAAMAPVVRVDSSFINWIDLRTVPEEVLASHPYVGKMAARGIVRLREVLAPEEFSLEAVVLNGILNTDAAARLSRYLVRQ